MARSLGRLLAAALLIISLVGCSDSTPQSGTHPSAGCDGEARVMFAGDSIMVETVARLGFPTGVVWGSVATGSSGFTRPLTGDDSTSRNIGERVLAALDSCNSEVDLVVFNGGINDLMSAQPLAPLVDAVTALDDELAARGIATVWLPITPWVVSTLTPFDHRYERRLEYNDWLRAAKGNDRVLECNDVLASPGAAVEQMNSAYRTMADLVTPDRVHPSSAGYQVYANCLTPKLAALY
ncbi:MAG TPA: SGNH/GDSL hydrolase family protein [Microthrixaceae bacterium]|nr:SGNH/GDSL hydrolase family protein [Microthrixaceae bacterium]